MLSIQPKNQDGFQVLLEDFGKQFTVFFDLWSYDQIFNFQYAARMFLMGLMPICRILVRERNQKRYWWLLETCINGQWGGVEVTFRPGRYSLWAKRKTYYLQNNLIDIEKHNIEFDVNYTISRQGINYCGVCGEELNPINKYCVKCDV